MGTESGGTVLFLALAPQASPLTWHGDAEYVIEHSAKPVVVTVDEPRVSPDPRLTVISIGDRLDRHPAMRTERILLHVLPARVLSLFDRHARRMAGTRGGSAVGRTAVRLIGITARKQRSLHTRLRKGLTSYVAPSVVIRSVLPAHSLDDVRHVVAMDRVSTPTAWRLARRWPDSPVTAGFPREAWSAGRDRD